MDTHTADEKLKELHIEEATVKANDRSAERYDLDPVAEKKLLRKIDWHIVPILWFMFMLAFLDRTNSKLTSPRRDVISTDHMTQSEMLVSRV